jgi:hypothetical protein
MSDPLTPGGAVAVAGRTFIVKKLSVAAEYALGQMQAAAAKAALGDGGFYSRNAKFVDHLRAQGRHADADAAVRRIVEMEVAGEAMSPEAVEAYRRSAPGLAAELYHRTRQTHPEVAADELAAIVTPVNAPEVFLALLDAITSEKKPPTPSASPAT